jgi:hypothetical protein
MTAELHVMLTTWLTEGTELEKQHARNRLALDESVEPPVHIPAADPWRPLILACEDHNPGCCHSPAAFCTRFGKYVTREECIECLTGRGITPGGQAPGS